MAIKNPNPFFRFPHPKVIEKIRKTQNFINQDINPDKFIDKGGMSLENFNTYIDFLQRRQNAFDSYIKKTEEYKAESILTEPKKPDPVIGTQNALVLLVDFSDMENTTSQDQIEKVLFSPENGVSSMRKYFQEVSWNQLDVQGDVYGWYRASNNYSHYHDLGNTSENTLRWKMPRARNLVKEVLTKFKDNEGSLDLSKYDSNGDGKLDILIVVYAGKGADRANFSYIYPHHGYMEPFKLNKDLEVDQYILMHELPRYDIGSFSHEVAHSLGLPDLYSSFDCSVVGKWCLMSLGCSNDDGRTPGHLSAWCKVHLGWVEPQIIKGNPQEYHIPYVSSSDKIIYRLDVSGKDGKEYFLIENRQQKGYDQHLPGSGLLIWHINEYRQKGHFPNFDRGNLFISLIQADGKNELETKLYLFKDGKLNLTESDFKGDYGDIYPGESGNRSFNNKSEPNSSSISGSETGISITAISDPGEVMQAIMGVESGNKPVKKKEKKDKVYFITIKSGKKFINGPEDSETLYSYQEGYKIGYKEGYEKGVKDFKKNFPI